MVTYNKFESFVGQLGLAGHELNADILRVALVNSPAPVDTNELFGDLTEIAAGNGYAAGGDDVTNLYSEALGVGTMTATDVVFTASGGTIGPFRYVILYNDKTGPPLDPLVAWWDYGSNLTLQDQESFTVDFQSDQILTIT